MSEGVHQPKKTQSLNSDKATRNEQPVQRSQPAEDIFLPGGRINRSAVAQLQRTIGNRATLKLLQRQNGQPPQIQTRRIHGDLEVDGGLIVHELLYAQGPAILDGEFTSVGKNLAVHGDTEMFGNVNANKISTYEGQPFLTAGKTGGKSGSSASGSSGETSVKREIEE